MFVDGIEYIKAVIFVGLKIDDFVFCLLFFFGIGMDLFMNVVMLCAVCYLWSEVVSGFGVQDLKLLVLCIYCQILGWSLIEQDLYNNVICIIIEVLAVMLGGIQLLYINVFDEVFGLFIDFLVCIVCNIQIIIQEELEFCCIVDLLVGFYYIELLID